MTAGPLGAGLRWALAEARALVQLERFFALLEAADDAATPDSLAQLAGALRGWRRSLRSGDDGAALDAGAHVWSALEASRRGVVERDRAIPAYRIRWACEHAPLHDRGLVTLARFYRTLPYSSASQSKYEYVVTRLLAGPLKRRRELVADPHDVLERLVEIERSCGADPVAVPEATLRSGIAALAAFVREAREQPDLASLTASVVFQRAGAFKAGLGAALFEPRVALAVVECNLRLGNALCELLAREVDEAPAPADVVAPPETHGVAEPPAPAAPAPAAEEEEELPPAPSPRAAELAQRPENAPLIVQYLTPPRSPEIYELDLDKFLSPLPVDAGEQLPGEAAERRRAFEMMLAADDLVWAREEGPVDDGHKAVVKQTARDMVALGNSLRAILTKAQQDRPEVVETLFYVADHLLWARLQLSASLNRPARKRISLAQSPQADLAPAPVTTPGRRRLTGWISFAAVALLLLLPGALVPPRPVDSEVRVLNPTSLPGGAHVYDARQLRSVLYVSVWPSWGWMSPVQRRDHLRALAQFSAPLGIDIVSVADRNGDPLGSFAEGEAVLLSDLPSETDRVP